ALSSFSKNSASCSLFKEFNLEQCGQEHFIPSVRGRIFINLKNGSFIGLGFIILRGMTLLVILDS
ncbi:hypothetical protein OFO99_28945, partial [Escherichia coli]|nr:hypothetical protein [Escherichia coli]